jgi:uncharacterized membrane protein SirB2
MIITIKISSMETYVKNYLTLSIKTKAKEIKFMKIINNIQDTALIFEGGGMRASEAFSIKRTLQS